MYKRISLNKVRFLEPGVFSKPFDLAIGTATLFFNFYQLRCLSDVFSKNVLDIILMLSNSSRLFFGSESGGIQPTAESSLH